MSLEWTSCYSKQWITDLLLYLHVTVGMEARCSSGIADSSATLCPSENLKFANNGALNWLWSAMITFLEIVIHSHVSMVKSSVVQVVRGSMLWGTMEGSAEALARSPMDCGYDSAWSFCVHTVLLVCIHPLASVSYPKVLVVGNYRIIIHGIPVDRMAIWLERNIRKYAGEWSIMPWRNWEGFALWVVSLWPLFNSSYEK